MKRIATVLTLALGSCNAINGTSGILGTPKVDSFDKWCYCMDQNNIFLAAGNNLMEESIGAIINNNMPLSEELKKQADSMYQIHNIYADSARMYDTHH